MIGQESIERILAENGSYVSTSVGVSMKPMLRNRRDTIVVVPADGILEKYDVVLYRRGEKYVLHRVIKVESDVYIIRGDNCAARELVPHGDVIGKLVSFSRGDRQVDMNSFVYRAYSVLICAANPMIRVRKRICNVGKRLLRKKEK